jgi:hypothetical protein
MMTAQVAKNEDAIAVPATSHNAGSGGSRIAV